MAEARDPYAATVDYLGVGEVSRLTGVSVRTLHHYDGIGLVAPSRRSDAGYRLYGPADLERLRQAVAYRRLGFGLGQIAAMLDDPATDVAAHLTRQLAAVTRNQAELAELAAGLERALEAHMSGTSLTPEEQREIFGESYSDEYAAEAEERWGDTDAWRQSRERTSRYGKEDWLAVKAETDAVLADLVAAKRAGLPPDSTQAMAAAEAHRRHIDARFYDCSHDMHLALAQMWVDDERFARTYEAALPGLAEYARDAVVANAARAGIADATDDPGAD